MALNNRPGSIESQLPTPIYRRYITITSCDFIDEVSYEKEILTYMKTTEVNTIKPKLLLPNLPNLLTQNG